MAVLVTRPYPDNEATGSALRTRGFAVLLAPMLRFEPLSFRDDPEAEYGAVIVTSANALRAIEVATRFPSPLGSPLRNASFRNLRTFAFIGSVASAKASSALQLLLMMTPDHEAALGPPDCRAIGKPETKSKTADKVRERLVTLQSFLPKLPTSTAAR